MDTFDDSLTLSEVSHWLSVRKIIGTMLSYRNNSRNSVSGHFLAGLTCHRGVCFCAILVITKYAAWGVFRHPSVFPPSAKLGHTGGVHIHFDSAQYAASGHSVANATVETAVFVFKMILSSKSNESRLPEA